MATDDKPTLYYNQFSICSLFSRYTFDLYNAYAPPKEQFEYALHVIDIYKGNQQLDHSYLKARVTLSQHTQN